MNKKILLLPVVVAILGVVGYRLFIHLSVPTPTLPLKEKEQACLKAGGVFVKIGLRDVEVCNFKTTDAGKSCTDSQQCQGSCVTEDANATSGNCTDWKIIEGCHAIFHKGKSSGIVCLD